MTHVYFAIGRARVDILLTGRLGRTEMTPDEGAEDFVSRVFHHATV